MGDQVRVDPNAIGLVASIRPRAGAEKKSDGNFAPEDMEIAVAIAVGCSKPSGLLARDGKQQVRMVPVAIVSRPLGEFIAQAQTMLDGQATVEQARRDVET